MNLNTTHINNRKRFKSVGTTQIKNRQNNRQKIEDSNQEP